VIAIPVKATQMILLVTTALYKSSKPIVLLAVDLSHEMAAVQ